MSEPDSARMKTIFGEALERQGMDRDAYLDRACASEPDLRRRVEALLLAAEKDDVFLGEATVGGAAFSAPGGSREQAGDRIGHFKILQLIGEGGFGSVYMAEQERPVRRRVALKIIKLGMDTKAIVARFEQERQALALMDHPNIAKVLDAGATQSGRPYFVMELVKGDPITEFSDKGGLRIEERLQLFTQVCQAVQHAHTKGIIHRDIKPNNVLVSTQDGRPLARVIDFGIAKATEHRLTEKTFFTEMRQLIGTPEYMSPEQAEGSLDIDTRTDVYSLGVLLYELLTGSTPFDGKRLRSAAFGELQRIIREDEPPRPSTRLSQSMETLATVAAQRRIEPKRLGMMIQGELDWIVMRALEKDRARRYETASGLGADVQRYLAGDAVLAAPPRARGWPRRAISPRTGPASRKPGRCSPRPSNARRRRTRRRAQNRMNRSPGNRQVARKKKPPRRAPSTISSSVSWAVSRRRRLLQTGM
jgi:serine/threonine protein kinase